MEDIHYPVGATDRLMRRGADDLSCVGFMHDLSAASKPRINRIIGALTYQHRERIPICSARDTCPRGGDNGDFAGACCSGSNFDHRSRHRADSIDPHFHNLAPTIRLPSTPSRLIEQDHSGNLLPGLATSWKPLDELTWEFKLRKGVKFHDGSDFDADDVIFPCIAGETIRTHV